jgi:hypothetical protein
VVRDHAALLASAACTRPYASACLTVGVFRPVSHQNTACGVTGGRIARATSAPDTPSAIHRAGARPSRRFSWMRAAAAWRRALVLRYWPRARLTAWTALTADLRSVLEPWLTERYPAENHRPASLLAG